MFPAPVIYVGAENGLYVLAYEERQWQVTSLRLEGKPVIDLTMLATPSARAYALVSGYGLFEVIPDGPTRQVCSANAHCLLVDAAGAQRMWLGVEPVGVLRSEDGGQNWLDLSDRIRAIPEAIDWSFPEPPFQAQMRLLAQMPGQPNTLLGGVIDGGLVRSVDGGDSWELVDAYAGCYALAVHPAQADFWLAATAEGLIFSADGGQTWADAGGLLGYSRALAILPSGNCLAATAASAPGNWVENAVTDLYRWISEDEGWQRISLPFSDYVTTLATDQQIVFAGTQSGKIYWSHDEGITWHQIVDLAVGINKIWSVGIN